VIMNQAGHDLFARPRFAVNMDRSLAARQLGYLLPQCLDRWSIADHFTIHCMLGASAVSLQLQSGTDEPAQVFQFNWLADEVECSRLEG